MYREITACRLCGSTHLVSTLNLGTQALTGVFPRRRDEPVSRGPLELVKCADGCGLLQLRHSFDPGEMYGQNYGYRSGLNQSMVRHLHDKVAAILQRVQLRGGDLIIDIGSNDSTLLQAYPRVGADLVGVDPTGRKFWHFYPPHVRLLPEFFSERAIRSAFGDRKARIITSVAMLYDLEQPLEFFRQVRNVIAPDGIWVFEQSYMPTMLRVNAYDTVCQEHIEYYGLRQIQWMTERTGFDILDVELNDVNGGSFSVVVAPKGGPHTANAARVAALLQAERDAGLDTLAPYDAFRERVFKHRDDLRALLARLRQSGQRVAALGASTKGNVLLQFCAVTPDDIEAIGEVNSDKFGCYTPGTLLPIVSETELRASRPDYMLVLPWHFRDSFIQRERAYLDAGGKLIFPLPEIEIVGRDG